MTRILAFLAAALTVLTTALPASAQPTGPNPAAGPAADLALGLSGVVDWSVQQPFIDVMKTARVWVGHRPGEWGGVEYPELVARGLVDERGWPTRIPRELRAIGTILLTDMPEDAYSLAGRYSLTFEGSGIVEVAGRARNTRYGPNSLTFDYTPGPGGVIVNVTRIDPADPVRGIEVMKQDYRPLHAAGEIFNPAWTQRIDGFGAFRFMDWMQTNDSTQSGWDRRPLPEDATWTRAGVPAEIMLRLANALGADPWFNMPHLASDDYMRRFAALVRDGLDPGLTAYVEYSNEVWNWQFAQARWAEARAIERWGREHAGVQYSAMRAARMADIWREVLGTGRLVAVIATQTGWLGREADILEAPHWQAEDPANRAPAAHFDAYAVAGYFSGLIGHEEKADMVRGWLADSADMAAAEADRHGLEGAAREAWLGAHRFDHAVELAARELRDGSVSGDDRDTLAALFGTILPYHRAVADRYGLDLVMYEGGTHVVGIGPVTEDDALTEFFTHLNYTSEMGDLYRQLLAGWTAAGGTLFNVFADVYPPNRWGSWGALRHLDDDNPRWRALTAPPPAAE